MTSGVLYPERPETLTTRDAIDRARVAEERAAWLVVNNALLRAEVKRLTESRDRWRAEALRCAVLLLLRDGGATRRE